MSVRFTSPVDGAILSERDGRLTRDGLELIVEGDCPGELPGELQINGCPAQRTGDRFRATITLKERESIISASLAGQEAAGPACRVMWREDFSPVFRLAIDDNIFFLRDLAARRPADIFDSFYLDGLRKIHRQTGMKVVLNLFFTTPEEDFNLADFPADYRGQFEDNAHWLRMAFHARKEFPDRPYQTREGASRIGHDYDAVASEIIRFAGERAYSPTTITHWGMVHPEAWQELYRRGTRLLSGYFVPHTGTNYQGGDVSVSADSAGDGFDVNYCMDAERSSWLSRHELLIDHDSGILFSKVDLCCNLTPLARIEPLLASVRANPATADVMDIMTHEQYFWPFYAHYLPDHFDRCMAAMQFCSRNGYHPAFFHEELVPAVCLPR